MCMYVLCKHVLKCCLGPVSCPQEAYVDGLEGEEFYQSLFDEDTEADKLILFPEQVEKMDSYVCFSTCVCSFLSNLVWAHSLCLFLNAHCRYKTEFMAVCHELLQLGLEEAGKRKTEREAFFHGHHQALTNNQRISTERVASYKEKKKEVGVDILGQVV